MKDEAVTVKKEEEVTQEPKPAQDEDMKTEEKQDKEEKDEKEEKEEIPLEKTT